MAGLMWGHFRSKAYTNTGDAVSVLTLIIPGAFILLALVILCFAAYKIKAKRFEFSTAVWKLASIKISIVSDEDPKPTKPTTLES